VLTQVRAVSPRSVGSGAVRVAGTHYRRFATFLVVGAAGVVVANGGLVILHEKAAIPVLAAAALAWQAAILVTFTLNSTVTWRGAHGRPLLTRFGVFELISVVGLGIYLATIAVAQDVFGLHYAIGGVAGSGVAALWNYAANHRFTFRWADPPGGLPAG
jgi:dolichol-phosphate mannosyltransferase